MPEVSNLKDAYKTIQQLIKHQKWREAHRACLELLRYDPENIKAIHLKNTIEKKVHDVNKNAIKADIKKLQPLWNEHQYKDLLIKLKGLEPYIPDYPQLKKLIQKATNEYEKQLRVDQEVTYKSVIVKIEALLKEHKYPEALLEAEKLRVMGIHETEIKKILSTLRSDWINNEIAENKTLVSSQKFEDILIFYRRLQTIDPDSEHLKKAIAQTKKTYQSYKVEEKKEFIYKSLEEIRTLYQLKKYEKTYAASLEILQIDPENKSALNFKNMSAKKIRQLIDEEVVDQMLNNQKDLTLQYKADPKSFTKI